jgi:transcriptional regulator with XRE-family HTH domain
LLNQDAPDSELIEFSRKLRRMRVSRGISQEKLAEAANLDIRSVQRFEAGEINIVLSSLIRIRKALGCKWSDLLPKDE